jgi:hypothetical protein
MQHGTQSLQKKHKIETSNDNPSIPNRFSGKSNYCNNEYPTSKTSNQLYNINKSTCKSNYTIETKPSIPIESSCNRSTNSFFKNESYLNNEPSANKKPNKTFSTALLIPPPNATIVMPTSPSGSQKAPPTTNSSMKNPLIETTTRNLLQQAAIKISPRMH